MSGSKVGPLAVLVAALGLATLPAAVAASWTTGKIALLGSTEVAVPVAFVLGLVAVAIARRARFRVERSVRRDGERVARLARFLAWGALYLATTGAIALGFYGLLVMRG